MHVKDSRKRLDGRRSILASHLNFGEEARGWDFVSPGHGDVDFEELFRALNRIGYYGPLSIEWEDSGMDRDWGAPDALAFVRRTDFAPSEIAFDAAMQRADDERASMRDARDRRRHARLRVHGQGARERVPHARVHGVAAAARPRLVSIAGRNEDAVAEAARRYGFERAVTDWHELVADPEVGLFDNSGPNNLHAEPTIAAAEAGKHVFCEKPLGRTAEESYEMWQRVEAAGVKHMTRLQLPVRPGCASRTADASRPANSARSCHFRGRYLQEWGTTDADAWRFKRDEAGSGALGDLGVARRSTLLGTSSARSRRSLRLTRTFCPGREVDDAFEAVVEFEAGAVGTIEATRFAAGRKNALSWEINGTKGSLAFDLERLNELQHSDGTKGFRTILVSETDHPFWEWWWPHGHIIGWEHTFVHEIHHLLTAIAAGRCCRAVRCDVRGRLPCGRGMRRRASLGRLGRQGSGVVPGVRLASSYERLGTKTVGLK